MPGGAPPGQHIHIDSPARHVSSWARGSRSLTNSLPRARRFCFPHRTLSRNGGGTVALMIFTPLPELRFTSRQYNPALSYHPSDPKIEISGCGIERGVGMLKFLDRVALANLPRGPDQHHRAA